MRTDPPETEGTPRRLRAAVVGAGPSGFYAAEALLKSTDPEYAVDLLDRLPAPFGLVRYGVAPDHQKIKNVIKLYERVANHERFRFFGNVNLGEDLTIDELREHYDQVVLAVGCETDRRLGIPGEDLPGSYSATEFVAWYNGHPDFRDRGFLLDRERVAVVGIGNVAMDVTRILLHEEDVLAPTDITNFALDELRASQVREVILLARRGAIGAAFSPKEIKEIGAMEGVDLIVDPADVEFSDEELAALDKTDRQNIEFLRERAAAGPTGAPKRVVLEFCASPVAILGNERVAGVRIEHNELVPTGEGRPRPKGTGRFDEFEIGAIFRSIGYHGRPLPGVPFDARAGIIPNEEGRVVDPEAGGTIVPATYVVGWIKRGPSGLIGTNKPDAAATVKGMVADAAGRTPRPGRPDLAATLDGRGLRYVRFPDWQALDAMEVERGERAGKIREKFTAVEEMLAAVDGAAAS